MVFSEIMCDGGHIRNLSYVKAIYRFSDVCHGLVTFTEVTYLNVHHAQMSTLGSG